MAKFGGRATIWGRLSLGACAPPQPPREPPLQPHPANNYIATAVYSSTLNSLIRVHIPRNRHWAYSHCSYCMRSRVYDTIVRPSVRPSVCLSHHSTTAAACGGFAAERRAGGIYRSTATGAHRQRRRSTGRSTALSSKCEQCHVYS